MKKLLIAVACTVLSSCLCKSATPQTSLSKPKLPCLGANTDSAHIIKDFPGKVYAIGDLHGDIDQTYAALKLIGAIDDKNKWVASCMIVVQTGDQIDRGDDDKQVLDALERLAVEAKNNDSRLIILNGNHEIMNTELDLRYTTKKANEAFNIGETLTTAQVNPLVQERGISIPEKQITIPYNELIKENELWHYAWRVNAFSPGKPYARLLANRSFYAIVNGTVFVHGGINSAHVQYGLEAINKELTAFFTTGQPPTQDVIADSGPLWLRDYSSPPNNPPQARACEELNKTLSLLGAQNMVVGHTVQDKINSACEGKIWRIDVGLSKAYKNRAVQVLEIDGKIFKTLVTTP